jgi:hypothetical protein
MNLPGTLTSASSNSVEIELLSVAAYIEQLGAEASKPTVTPGSPGSAASGGRTGDKAQAGASDDNALLMVTFSKGARCDEIKGISSLALRIGRATLPLGLIGCMSQQPAPSVEAVAHQIEQDAAAAQSGPANAASADAAQSEPPSETTRRQQVLAIAQQTYTNLNGEYRALTALLDSGLGAYYPD